MGKLMAAKYVLTEGRQAGSPSSAFWKFQVFHWFQRFLITDFPIFPMAISALGLIRGKRLFSMLAVSGRVQGPKGSQE